MSPATALKFKAATKGMTLTDSQKRELVAFYKDDIDAGDIENVDEVTFRMLVRDKAREWGWISVAEA